MARPGSTDRLQPVRRQRTVGPLAMSLLAHAALLAAGVAATLLLPTTPPAPIFSPPTFSPPTFSVELTIAPTPATPAQPTLADSAPLPQPPPDALVVPHAADMAAALPTPDTPPTPLPVPTVADMAAVLPAPLPVPTAADMAAVLPAPQPPPTPAPVPSATDLAAVLTDPAAPPEPTLAPPPPPRARPAARPVQPAAAKPATAQPPVAKHAVSKHAVVKHAVAKPAPAQPAANPAPPGPAAAPAPQTTPADTTPLLIANPRFRTPPRPPVYPRRAIELRAQGEALIAALLDPSGAPHELRVLRSSGHPMLDRAALDAVGGWAFEPGRRAGQPVAARVEIPVRFTLR